VRAAGALEEAGADPDAADRHGAVAFELAGQGPRVFPRPLLAAPGAAAGGASLVVPVPARGSGRPEEAEEEEAAGGGGGGGGGDSADPLALGGYGAADPLLAGVPDLDLDLHASHQSASSLASVSHGSTKPRRAGDKVEAMFKGQGKHYPGKIQKVNSDGTYEVLFDDGDKDPAVKESSVK
jgi:hypothetical protein